MLISVGRECYRSYRSSTLMAREMRDFIFHKLWQSVGTKQHIFWHGNHGESWEGNRCLWPCTADFNLEDSFQSQLKSIKKAKGRPKYLIGNNGII